MVLASPGPLLTPPPSSSIPKTPIGSYSAQTPFCNRNPTPPLPGGRGGRRRGRGTGGQSGPQPDADALATPPPQRNCVGRQLTTLQPTKRQPATASAAERGRRVTTARRTTTRAAPGLSDSPWLNRSYRASYIPLYSS
jgi:hypothetical protein